MTDQAVHRGRTYQSGDWYGVIGPHVVVILPPQEKGRVAALWALADEGAGFDETLDALISDGLRALHGFVLISTTDDDTKVVIRGEARASFVAGGETVDLEGSSATTWVERSLRDVTSMVVDVGEVPDGTPAYAIGQGLVRVSRLSEGEPVTEPDTEPVDEPAPPAEPASGDAGFGGSVVAASAFGPGEPDQADVLDEVDPGPTHLDSPEPGAIDDDGADPLAETSVGGLDAVAPLEDPVEDPLAQSLDEPVEDEATEAFEPLDEPLTPGETVVDAPVEPAPVSYDSPEVDPWIDPSGDTPVLDEPLVAERSFEDSFDTATPSPLDDELVADAPSADAAVADIWSPTPVEPAEPLAYSSSPSHAADVPADSLGPVDDEDDDEDELHDLGLDDETDGLEVPAGAHAADVPSLAEAADDDFVNETEDEVPGGRYTDWGDDEAGEPEDDLDDLDDDQPTETFVAQPDLQPDHDGLTHLSPFDQDEFELARPGIPGQAPAPPITSRPVARLMISTGESIDVDRVVILGRAPMAPRGSSVQPLLVPVPSPHQEISSTHVEVRPGSGADHGTAVVTDLGSTNGTIVIQPGLEPDELQPGVSMQLIPGAVIDLGDGVIITVTRP